MASATEFRTCPNTGLRVDLSAERLIKANAVAAIVFLAIGGLFGVLVALTRWPAVHLLPADWFYLALTAHGLDVLLVWIIFFEMARAVFRVGDPAELRLAAPEVGVGRVRPDAGRGADHERRGACRAIPA